MKYFLRSEDEDPNYWPAVVDVFIGFLAFLLISALVVYSEATEKGIEPPKAKKDFARELSLAFAGPTANSRMTLHDQPRVDDVGFSELKIYFPAAFLFETCHTDLTQPAVVELTQLRTILNKFEKEIERVQITGHTDTDRPSAKSYCLQQGIHTNWELSARRAITVLELLAPDDNGGLDPRKVWGAALGEYHPVMASHTAEAKARNRRIEILLRFME